MDENLPLLVSVLNYFYSLFKIVNLFFLAFLVRLVFTPVVVHPTSIHKDLEMVGTIAWINYNSLGSILWIM